VWNSGFDILPAVSINRWLLPPPRRRALPLDRRLVNPDWSRRVARERLNANLVELPGSHSPFLSRPAGLAEVLHAAPLKAGRHVWVAPAAR
jgi:hypothetical protein